MLLPLMLLLLLPPLFVISLLAGAAAAAAPPLPSSVGLRQAVNVAYSAGNAFTRGIHFNLTPCSCCHALREWFLRRNSFSREE
jgi:hypothetical protein